MVPTSFSAIPEQKFIFMFRINQLKFKLEQHVLGSFKLEVLQAENN
jgi:hypothetical protein